MSQPHQHNDSKVSGTSAAAGDGVRAGAGRPQTGKPLHPAPRIHCYEFSILLLASRRELLNEIREQFIAGPGHESAAVARAKGGKAALIDQAKLAVIQRRWKLEQIEVALGRIADGNYGLCVDCGEEIGRSVLKAQPTMARCPACQTCVLPDLMNGER